MERVKRVGERRPNPPLIPAESDELTPATVTREPAAARGARLDPRRSRRVYIAMPVMIRGERGGKPFEEVTTTLTVSAHGAMIYLSTPVQRDQKLIVKNLKSEEETECRVALLGQPENRKTQVAIEFTSPGEYFWRIAFPPENWDPSSRKLPENKASSHRGR